MTDSDGNYIGHYSGFCSVHYTGSCSGSNYAAEIPYGSQTEDDALFFEDGFKAVRGYLTEGRYLTFESNGQALTNSQTSDNSGLSATEASADHEDISQRWVLHALTEEGTTFTISSAVDGRYISKNSTLSSSSDDAESFNVAYVSSRSYTLQTSDDLYLNIDSEGSVSYDSTPGTYQVFSVTYHA